MVTTKRTGTKPGENQNHAHRRWHRLPWLSHPAVQRMLLHTTSEREGSCTTRQNPNLAEAKRRRKAGSSHLYPQSHSARLGQLLQAWSQQEDFQLHRPSRLEGTMAMGKKTTSEKREKVDSKEVFHAPSRQTMDVLHHSRNQKSS